MIAGWGTAERLIARPKWGASAGARLNEDDASRMGQRRWGGVLRLRSRFGRGACQGFDSLLKLVGFTKEAERLHSIRGVKLPFAFSVNGKVGIPQLAPQNDDLFFETGNMCAQGSLHGSLKNIRHTPFGLTRKSIGHDGGNIEKPRFAARTAPRVETKMGRRRRKHYRLGPLLRVWRAPGILYPRQQK